MDTLKGLWTALITPFDERGQLDLNGLKSLINLQKKSGASGILILGSTAEGTSLNYAEKEKVITTSREACGPDFPLMVNTGSSSTQETLVNSAQAKELGADCVLVITPYYCKPTQEGIIQHFEILGARVDIPTVIYHHPGRSSCEITSKTLQRLSALPHIIGVKDASGNLNNCSDFISKSSGNFSYLSGDDALTFPMLSLGAHGVISVAGNIAPKSLAALCKHARNGDWIACRKLHYALFPLMQALCIESNPIPVKSAMQWLGMPSGSPRLPLLPLSQENWRPLKNALNQCEDHLCQPFIEVSHG